MDYIYGSYFSLNQLKFVISIGTIEEVTTRLTSTTPMTIIVREMQKPDSGLEIRDRNWLKICIPNALIGKVHTLYLPNIVL